MAINTASTSSKIGDIYRCALIISIKVVTKPYCQLPVETIPPNPLISLPINISRAKCYLIPNTLQALSTGQMLHRLMLQPVSHFVITLNIPAEIDLSSDTRRKLLMKRFISIPKNVMT